MSNYISEDRARKLARYLVSKKLISICGMDIDSVPDTAEICNIVDELQEIIENNDINDTKIREEIKNFLTDSINDDTIEELIL